MANILDGICPKGSVLDGLAELLASTTRKEWFAITRQLIQQTIMNLLQRSASDNGVLIACFFAKSRPNLPKQTYSKYR